MPFTFLFCSFDSVNFPIMGQVKEYLILLYSILFNLMSNDSEEKYLTFVCANPASPTLQIPCFGACVIRKLQIFSSYCFIKSCVGSLFHFVLPSSSFITAFTEHQTNAHLFHSHVLTLHPVSHHPPPLLILSIIPLFQMHFFMYVLARQSHSLLLIIHICRQTGGF